MRAVVAALSVLAVLPMLLLAQAATGNPDRDPNGHATARAERALERARAVLHGHGDPRSATLVLAELFARLADLPPDDRRAARALLARPAADQKLCRSHVCVHYTTSGSDAPPPPDADGDEIPDWVETTARVMEKVWRKEIGQLGYRRPASDGTRGGDSRLDVYLQDVGAQGLYGYCATEAQVPDQPFRTSGYCVLDNDYDPDQFPSHTPVGNLRVTAAHEFFHAVQFNYDAREDLWIMEATATWMEERFADGVNDNRTYLDSGQLVRPGIPLDASSGGLGMYGNWIFFERFSGEYGVTAVRRLWERMQASGSDRGDYSTQAIRGYLADHGLRFPTFYARFAAGNLTTDRSYPEGAAYKSAPVARTWWLDRRDSRHGSYTLDHLTSRNVLFRPASSMSGVWRLRIRVDLPNATRGPAASITVWNSTGSLLRKQIALDSSGAGVATVGFGPGAGVTQVALTPANGSTRMTNCYSGRSYACHGVSRDNDLGFAYTARVVH